MFLYSFTGKRGSKSGRLANVLLVGLGYFLGFTLDNGGFLGSYFGGHSLDSSFAYYS